MSKPSIGIVGGGVVGGAVKAFFKNALVYDKYKESDPIDQVAKSRFIFICVPTPYKQGLDLSVLDGAVKNTVDHLSDPENQLIVIKSTAIPGTTQKYQDLYPKANFAFNPEFLRDKTANEDFVNNDRQIVGGTKKTKDSSLAKELLEILPDAPYERIVPSEVAELLKYASNTYLALKVIFANQIYDICESAKIDYEKVKQAVQADKRIGESHWDILHTESSLGDRTEEVYRGYGGKCFPKDINSLIADGEKLGIDVSLFKAGKEVNLELNGGNYDD